MQNVVNYNKKLNSQTETISFTGTNFQNMNRWFHFGEKMKQTSVDNDDVLQLCRHLESHDC